MSSQSPAFSRGSAFAVLLQISATALAVAHEGTGRAGFKEPEGVEAEVEFYAGKEGYLHGGLGVIAPLNDRQKIGVVGHFVREDSDGEIFPSLGAEFVQELGEGYSLEGFTFGYLPVEDQNAWALGARGSRTFEMREDVSISPFFGPAYADVRALDEATEAPVSIGHLMLLGGVTIEAGSAEITLFASHSFFSRDPVGLETHVDLEEMTHFAAYENNDGFARNTAGAEFSYPLTDWLALTGGYAWIEYEERTRHAISFAPEIKVTSRLTVSAGIQFLRGDGDGNTLMMTGAAFSF